MTHTHTSPGDLVVLHTLRCAGSLSLQRVTALVAPLVTVDVEDVLLSLGAAGLVAHSGGAFGGWRLTDEGRAADAQRIAAELREAGARADVESAYEAFLPLNQPVLDLCGTWQIRSLGPPLVLNDHSDRVYDGRVLAMLSAANTDALQLCTGLAARLHRFSSYGTRLASALRRAKDGEQDLVTDGPDSYHSVWLQLHEDLLATLGLQRGG